MATLAAGEPTAGTWQRAEGPNLAHYVHQVEKPGGSGDGASAAASWGGSTAASRGGRGATASFSMQRLRTTCLRLFAFVTALFWQWLVSSLLVRTLLASRTGSWLVQVVQRRLPADVVQRAGTWGRRPRRSAGKVGDGSAFASTFSAAAAASVQSPLTSSLALRKRKTLVLDLDETLVHSSIRPPAPSSHAPFDFRVDVVIEGVNCSFFVFKRPQVDRFLREVAKWYDVLIFTASLRQYADPLIDILDVHRVARQRLFRESCVQKNGHFIKDLGHIGLDLSQAIIIDNSPIAYSHNKDNAIPIDHFFGDNPWDDALPGLLPLLEAMQSVSDVRSILSLRLCSVA